jgi:hypothetical protein
VTKLFNVNRSEMIISEDLGSRSNNTNELHFLIQDDFSQVLRRYSFEGRSGKGFFAIGDHAKISRS